MLFKRFKKPAILPEMEGENKKPSLPEGEICVSCTNCKKTVFSKDLEDNLFVCPKCNHHQRISAKKRIELLTDKDSFNELFNDIISKNVIDFPDYDQKIQKAKLQSGLNESVVVGTALIDGIKTAVFVMDAAFMMGSMGHATGEKITLLFEYAIKNRLPVVGFTVSGGARMQEGIISLMQMAKTAAAVKKHSNSGGLYITVLTDPTTGGVTASFAMLGDVILAEPNALIGFAGPRVIEQTLRQKLPNGFQRAEFLLEKGFVDRVVERKNQKQIIASLLSLAPFGNQSFTRALPLNENEEIANEEQKAFTAHKEGITTEEQKAISAFERVLNARKPDRPSGLDFINGIFENFIEIFGDRRYGDDKAVVAGFATLFGMPVTVVALEKGHDTKEKLKRNFGCAHPEGYRKALRIMKLSQKLNRPVVCFVDTAGAYCGIGAEERGQGSAIAENLAAMSDLSVPILSLLIGEGGSGGALALAVSDNVWMLESAVYSVISPEGCASILYKDEKKASIAAEALKMTAFDLFALRVVDRVIAEKEDKACLFNLLKKEVFITLGELMQQKKEDLVSNRYNRFRKF